MLQENENRSRDVWPREPARTAIRLVAVFEPENRHCLPEGLVSGHGYGSALSEAQTSSLSFRTKIAPFAYDGGAQAYFFPEKTAVGSIK